MPRRRSPEFVGIGPRLIALGKVVKKRGKRQGQTVRVRDLDGKVKTLRSGDRIEVTMIYNERHRTVFPPGVDPHPQFSGFAKGDETVWVWEVV